MNITERRRAQLKQRKNTGYIQDHSVSTTTLAPYFPVTKPRIRYWRADCIGLFYPIPSTYLTSLLYFLDLHPSFLMYLLVFSISTTCWYVFVISYNSTYIAILLFADLDTINTSSLSTSKALVLVLIIFMSALIALGLLYTSFPDLEE